MAAVTVNSRENTVLGNKRVVMASVQVANTGDTFVTGLSSISAANATPSTAAASGLTISGGTITFAQAADTAVQVVAFGN